MAITTQWLVDQFDLETDNSTSTIGADNLWTEAEVVGYADLAQKEFCRWISCIPDATSYADLPVVADDPYVDIDDLITEIRQARLVTANRMLSVRTVKEMHQEAVSCDYGQQIAITWETQTGAPRYVITDYEMLKLRLSPIPEEDDELALLVYRMPSDLTSVSSAIEIPNKFRRGLLHKMKALAYGKQDADVYDLESVKMYESYWARHLLDCDREVKIATRGPQTVVYGGL